jgi:hypothetical protein
MSTYPTIRELLLQLLYLPTAAGAQLGIKPDQWTALKSGAPVVVTREQLKMFGHTSMAANLNDYALWTLTGASTLTPAS